LNNHNGRLKRLEQAAGVAPGADHHTISAEDEAQILAVLAAELGSDFEPWFSGRLAEVGPDAAVRELSDHQLNTLARVVGDLAPAWSEMTSDQLHSIASGGTTCLN